MSFHLETLKSKAGSLLARFRRDARGNVAIITALCALPLFIAAGVAIDVARSSRSQNALQVAVDAAALSIGASEKANLSGLSPAQKEARKKELKKMAEDFVKANYRDEGEDVTVDVEVSNEVIAVAAHKIYPTTLMNLAGFRTVDLGASAEVKLQGIAGNIEIVLVMDTTGSMDENGKMDAAKEAAKILIDTILKDKPSAENVKFALVPFSGSVNVGADKLNSGWIDTTGKAPISKTHFADATYHNMKAWTEMKYTNAQGQTVPLPWNGCVETRLDNLGLSDGNSLKYLSVNDTPPDVSKPSTLFTPYLAPDEPSSGSANYPNKPYLTDSQETKDLSNPKTDTKRQNNQKKYNNKIATKLTDKEGPWYNCAASPIVPLVHERSLIDAGINAMKPRGNTVLPEGLMWGWRVLSPGLPYTEGKGFNDKDWRKVVVFMTDGMNDVSVGVNSLNRSAYTSYGYVNDPTEKNRFGTQSTSQAIEKLNQKLIAVCNGLKAMADMRPDPKDPGKQIPSVEIYTIAFQAPSAAQTLLQQCASNPATKYYRNAENTAQLKDAFETIGARLKALYLSK